MSNLKVQNFDQSNHAKTTKESIQAVKSINQNEQKQQRSSNNQSNQKDGRSQDTLGRTKKPPSIINEATVFKKQVSQQYLFEDLLQRYESLDSRNQSAIIKWILLTQKTIWKLSNYLKNNKKVIDLNIHMRQIECEVGVSTLAEVVLMYEKQINKRLKYYEMQQSWQAKSHMLLIRAIAAIVAFQSVKLNREKKHANLSQFRVPFDIQQLYQNFYSTNKQANKALKHLKTYHSYRKNRQKLFQLSPTNQSFEKFARKMGRETRSARMWVQTMNHSLERQKSLLMRQSTTLQQISEGKSQSKSQEQQTTFQSSTHNLTIQESICQYYFDQDPWLLAFLMNIPADIMGMMKLLFLAQSPVQKNKTQFQINKLINVGNLPQDEKLSINILAKNTSIDSIKGVQDNEISRIYIYSDNSIECKNYSQIKFYKTMHGLLSEEDRDICPKKYQIPFIMLGIILIIISLI